ncbi:MAG TPA: hypothetical protein VIJ59_09065 [Caulobacteraceae bacterium]
MKFRHMLTASAAVVLLAGCADYGHGPGYVGVGYIGGPVADVDYDGYYDGSYGPIYDGYWGDNGAFFYRTSENDHWRRGDTTHFRRDAAPGFNHMQGHTRAAPNRQGDHHRSDHP